MPTEIDPARDTVREEKLSGSVEREAKKKSNRLGTGYGTRDSVPQWTANNLLVTGELLSEPN